ncbi:MAG TPA: ferritin family protein [Sedimentisphaerales bacterium]|nr:ferritin family protein [Sedimentisphaerales bacterium]
MSMPFNADEIFEMAEHIERNGAKFYRKAADKFTALRKLLLDLAVMEDEHEKIFAAMRTELSGEEADPPVFDPDGEAQMYLRVMADGHVFNLKADPAEKLADVETAEDLLKMAMGVERDSIAFYVGLRESISRKAGRDKVEGIIKEEMKHVAVLNERLEAIKQAG